jgi:hypothetical protein
VSKDAVTILFHEHAQHIDLGLILATQLEVAQLKQELHDLIEVGVEVVQPPFERQHTKQLNRFA